MDVHELRTIEFEGSNITTDLEALRSIEINIADACNRACAMCPHSLDTYKASRGTFSIELAETLNKHLREIDYKHQISLTGFGEPLLNKKLPQIAAAISKGVQLGWMEVSTNGDIIRRDTVEKLVNSGVTNITISLYDEDNSDYFIDMLAGLEFELSFKHLYDDSYGRYVNRVQQVDRPQPLFIQRYCSFPFSRMLIDWDGTALLCANDWRRVTNFGNIRDRSINEIWNGEDYTRYREMHMDSKRSLSPCSECNIDGGLYGKNSYEYFKQRSK